MLAMTTSMVLQVDRLLSCTSGVCYQGDVLPRPGGQ